MDMTLETVETADKNQYIVREQALATEIKKYLIHFAAQIKVPMELSIHARPQGIAADIYNALLTHEQHFLPRREELAAHECANPHNAVTLDAGRRELAVFIADIAVPLAENTWALDVHVDVKIGHDLPAPVAVRGLAMCITFDCKNGVMRQRFAPTEETQPSEDTVTLGMTLVCRPGKIGAHPIEDIGRGGNLILLQSDAALYRWTIQALILMERLRSTVDAKFSVEEQNILHQASDALRCYVVILRLNREKRATAVAAAETAETAANLSAEPMAFEDELRQILNSTKHISSALGDAIEHLEEAMNRTITEPHQPSNGAHISHYAHIDLVPDEG